MLTRNSMRRYFITGATGFIGKQIVRELLQRPDTESILCLTRGKRRDLIQHPRVSYWIGDIRTADIPSNRLAFTDLIHGAADANDLHYHDSQEVAETITLGTKRILEWGATITRRVVLSSGAVTRDTPYGNAKKECEKLAIKHNAKIARIFSVIGPEIPVNGQFAAGKFIWQAEHGRIQVTPGNSYRTYLDVRDCAKWILQILDNPEARTFDVAGNFQTSIHDLAKMIGSIWNVPVTEIKGLYRADNYQPDISHALAIGCEQTLSLRQSLERIYESRIRGQHLSSQAIFNIRDSNPQSTQATGQCGEIHWRADYTDYRDKPWPHKLYGRFFGPDSQN